MKFAFTSLRDRCLATLCYFDLFDYPLTFGELQSYFFGGMPGERDLQDFLAQQHDLIHHQDGFYFLKGRDLIVVSRGQNEKTSKEYWKKVRRFLPLIRFVPFIKMVGICNTLAINNASKDSDIDLFIVAKTGRLHFVRFLTTALFGLLGVRRHGQKIARRFCLSFFVDETALNLEKIQDSANDIYLPYWILTMRPIYGSKTYVKFVYENAWICKYFGRNFLETVPLRRDFWKDNFLSFFARLKEWLWRGKMGDFVEKKLGALQMDRHQKNLPHLGAESSVVVSDHMLKFHNIDRRKEIAERFERKLHELL